MSLAVPDIFYPTAASVLGQLRNFLEARIREFDPDTVVVIERKGTAVYRAALESSHSGTLPGWDNVISSGSISLAPKDLFIDRRIMVFDDMLRNGNSLREILDELLELGYTDSALSNVHVAAFASHEKARSGYTFGGSKYPHAVHLRNLTTDAYHSVRSQVVSALQESGSLMLDTEHIEVRLTQKAPLSEIAHALSRTGQVVAFQSAAGRTNLTVFYDEETVGQDEADLFPEGTCLQGVVRKCRVVERLPGEFAVIPISLPDVPRDWMGWTPAARDEYILDPEQLSSFDDEALFQAIALRASLQPLSLAIKDLAIAGSAISEFALPTLGVESSTNSGFDLSHLHVVYPWLDLAALHERLLRTFEDARRSGKRLSRRKWAGSPTSLPHQGQLQLASRALLQRIADAVDRRAAEAHSGGFASVTKGLTMREIMALGASCNPSIAAHYVSSCMDSLIDEALLITRVEKIGMVDGRELIGRTYLPDGEVASEQVRDFTRRFGMVNPPELP